MQPNSTLAICSRTAALVLAAAWFASQASAMSLRELQALEKTGKQGENYVRYYLVGVMEGALEGHLQDVRNGAKAVICLKGRRLEPHMAPSLFGTELRRNAGVYEADMPVQLVMTNALANFYHPNFQTPS
ncbi:MAG: hypothetical protein CVU24_05915 [Betaproteobacteria bacterium HGW-Betaproteobacteria-18]|nr:MAG: hypothetical protein CVU24_05915 [Betaproteobacteria bacterium HGW-Betaproteobacteria-18]